MKLYTFGDARPQFSKVLDTAKKKKERFLFVEETEVFIFLIVAEHAAVSPFDVEEISSKVTTSEIVGILRRD